MKSISGAVAGAVLLVGGYVLGVYQSSPQGNFLDERADQVVLTNSTGNEVIVRRIGEKSYCGSGWHQLQGARQWLPHDATVPPRNGEPSMPERARELLDVVEGLYEQAQGGQ